MDINTDNRIQSASERTRELVNSLLAGSVQDRYPIYNELRETGDGVHFSDLLQGYIVTRHADVKRIFTEWKTFSSEIFWSSSPSQHDPANSEHRRFVDLASYQFMFSNPPAHTRIRSTFRHAFTPDAIAKWHQVVHSISAELLDRYPRGEEFDIMPGFAADVPVAVIAAVLGVPEDARDQFRYWSYAYASTFDPLVQGQRRNQAIMTSLELFDYLGELIAARKAEPRDDLITTLVQTDTLDGSPLGDVELVAQLALLLVAGNETTTALIGAGLTLLFEHPDIRDRLQADLSLLPEVIEEMLRMEPPLHFGLRRSAAEATLGDHCVPEGSMLFPCVAAANRDPRCFDEPDSFRPWRVGAAKLITFGQGIHFCVGAPLARMEGRIVFEYILQNFPHIRPGQTPPTRHSKNLSEGGWQTRPVIL